MVVDIEAIVVLVSVLFDALVIAGWIVTWLEELTSDLMLDWTCGGGAWLWAGNDWLDTVDEEIVTDGIVEVDEEDTWDKRTGVSGDLIVHFVDATSVIFSVACLFWDAAVVDVCVCRVDWVVAADELDCVETGCYFEIKFYVWKV